MHRVAGAALAVMLGVVASVGANAQSPQGLARSAPSVTGSYLAGNAALTDLRTDLASRYFLDSVGGDWHNPVLANRTLLALLAAGQVSDAASIAQHMLDLDQSDEIARLTLGAIALKQRRFSSASQILRPLGDGTLIGITGGIMRAWALIGNGDASRAYQLVEEIGEGGFDEFLVFHRALMADVAGDRDDAIAYAREAYEADPYVTRIAEAYVRILGNAGRFEDAREVLDAYTAEGLVHPLLDAARPAIEQDRRPGLFAGSVQAGAAEMFHGLGTALARDGSRELGVVFMQMALYLHPDSDVVRLSLGELLQAGSRYDEAIAVYESIPESSPLHTMALVREAENLDARGDREEAIARLEALIEREPDNIDALGVLGDLLRYDEQWEASAEAYSGLIELIDGDRPRDWRYFYVRGIAYERARMWPSAEADFQQALALNPDQPQVLNYLGYSWVDQGVNLEEALEMIERAVELQPRDGYIIDSLGWAFYKLGRIDEAIEELERAVRILPNDPEINDHLGDAYWQAGRQLEAVFQWTVARAVDERGEVAERAATKLEQGLVEGASDDD